MHTNMETILLFLIIVLLLIKEDLKQVIIVRVFRILTSIIVRVFRILNRIIVFCFLLMWKPVFLILFIWAADSVLKMNALLGIIALLALIAISALVFFVLSELEEYLL